MQTQHRPFDNLDGGERNSVARLMCQPNTTIGVMIVDASQSMEVHGQAPARAVDQAVDLIRMADDGRHYYLGIVQFNDTMSVLQKIQPVGSIKPLIGYHASGSTRLYGTVCDVLVFLLNQARECGTSLAPDLRVIVGVFSDGDDTISKPHYRRMVREASKIAFDQGWKLQAVGMGVDSKVLVAKLGFDPALAMDVEASEDGMTRGTTSVANTMTGFDSSPRIPPTRTNYGIGTNP